MNLNPVIYWINERESIRIKKERGDPWPWTTDPTLQRFSFCNVRREDDRVTRWIDANIRKPYANHPHLWFMLCIARTINWPPTLQELILARAWPSAADFLPRTMSSVLDERKARKEKVYTGAYMIRAENDHSLAWGSWSKQRYIGEIVLGALWEHRDEYKDIQRTLEAMHSWLLGFRGWGPFMAYQAVVDMAFTPLLADAPDRHTWAAAGPGTIRGLNRVFGRPVKKQLIQAQALEELREVDRALRRRSTIPFDSLSDVCNIMCETEKVARVLNNEGRPRALYHPKEPEHVCHPYS